jgi:hypothetical protein
MQIIPSRSLQNACMQQHWAAHECPRTCPRQRATWSKSARLLARPVGPCRNPSTAANLGLSPVPAIIRLPLELTCCHHPMVASRDIGGPREQRM